MGIFILIGAVLKRPLDAGLLYGFLWESFALQLPGDVPQGVLIAPKKGRV